MHDSAASGLQMILSDQASVEADRMDIVEDGPYIKQRNATVPLPVVNEEQSQVVSFLQETRQLYSSHWLSEQRGFIPTSSQHSNTTTPDHYPATMTSLDKVPFQSKLRSVSVEH